MLNPSLITRFVPLEELLDDNVHKNLKIVVIRGGKKVTLDNIKVQDLHSITPATYFECGGYRDQFIVVPKKRQRETNTSMC